MSHVSETSETSDHQEDKNKQAKLTLIHRILEKEFSTELTDDDIWSLYASWILTYRPPVKSNRYLNLLVFVHAYPLLFVPATIEDLQERDRKKVVDWENSQRKAWEERMMVDWIRFRDAEIHYVQRHSHNPAYLEKKEYYRIQLLDALQKNTDCQSVGWGISVDDDLPCHPLRHFFTIQELLDLGMMPEQIPNSKKRWEIIQWPEMSIRAIS